ncbi:TetR/AcrR family transcriptional regulator [Actinokineospora soli]
MSETSVPNRLDRRKARTRAALVAAARQLLARGGTTEVSIQEITDLADVGFGSFYNHFPTKAELFEAAVAEALEEHGALLDEITADLDDPAEVFAASVRLTVLLYETHPQIARIMTNAAPAFRNAPTGLAPRALRDLTKAKAAGRFDIDAPTTALACAGGAILGVLNALDEGRITDVRHTADEVALNLLRMFGLPGPEAREIVARPLPAATRPTPSPGGATRSG